MRRFEESLHHVSLARRLDPSSRFINIRAGWVYLYAGKTDRARVCWQHVLASEPSHPDARIGLAVLFILAGAYSQAAAELEPLTVTGYRGAFSLGFLAHAYAKSGRRRDALVLLDELIRRSASENIPPLSVTYAYLGLGDTDQSFAWLEKDYEQHRWFYHLNVNPLLKPLRSDPRFRDLARRVGLTAGEP